MQYRRYEGDNFVLDQQVVRAALKACEKIQTAGHATSRGTSSPFSAYLRHVRSSTASTQNKPIDSPDWSDWQTPVLVQELRAARIVEDRLLLQKLGEVDASADQRVSRAVTEAYVAAQIGELIKTIPLKEPNATIIQSLFRLVSFGTSMGQRTAI